MAQWNHRGELVQPSSQRSQRFQSPQPSDNMASPRTPPRQKNRSESPRQSPQPSGNSPTSSSHASRQPGNMPPSPTQQHTAQYRGNAPTSASQSSRQPGFAPISPNQASQLPSNFSNTPSSPQQGARQTNGMASQRPHLQQGGSSSSREPSPSPAQRGNTSPRRPQNQASHPERDYYSNFQMGNTGYSPYDGTMSGQTPYDNALPSRQMARQSPGQFDYSVESKDFQGDRTAMAYARGDGNSQPVERQSSPQYMQRPAGAMPLIESTVIVPRTQTVSWWSRLKDKGCCGGTRIERRPKGVQQTSSSMALQQKGYCCATKDSKQEYCCGAVPRTTSRQPLALAWGEEIFGH